MREEIKTLVGQAHQQDMADELVHREDRLAMIETALWALGTLRSAHIPWFTLLIASRARPQPYDYSATV